MEGSGGVWRGVEGVEGVTDRVLRNNSYILTVKLIKYLALGKCVVKPYIKYY